MAKLNIKGLSKAELEAELVKLGAKPYRAAQVFRWLYKSGAKHFDEMTDIPAALREDLKEHFRMTGPALLDSRMSKADGTTKYLLKLEDGNTIETVFLPEEGRSTICLSTQVGCRYGCLFCASAKSGFVRNLSASEILDEALFVKGQGPAAHITNLVFMGIGEPLDNYDNVMKAIRVLNDPDAFHIGARRMTISTCGLIPGIEKLGEEGLQVELSVSLHSAIEGVRSRLVPANKIYPLKDLMAACRNYTGRTNRVITFEYVMIKGVNMSDRDAEALSKLLRGLKCKVNLISYNQIRAEGYEPPGEREMREFAAMLKDRRVNVTRRASKGEEIDAGCGQLRISKI